MRNSKVDWINYSFTSIKRRRKFNEKITSLLERKKFHGFNMHSTYEKNNKRKNENKYF